LTKSSRREDLSHFRNARAQKKGNKAGEGRNRPSIWKDVEGSP